MSHLDPASNVKVLRWKTKGIGVCCCTWCTRTFRLKKEIMQSSVATLYFRVFGTVNGRNPAPVEVGSVSHYLQGFINPRWLGMGFLNHQQYFFSVLIDHSKVAVFHPPVLAGGDTVVATASIVDVWTCHIHSSCLTFLVSCWWQMELSPRNVQLFFFGLVKCEIWIYFPSQ